MPANAYFPAIAARQSAPALGSVCPSSAPESPLTQLPLELWHSVLEYLPHQSDLRHVVWALPGLKALAEPRLQHAQKAEQTFNRLAKAWVSQARNTRRQALPQAIQTMQSYQRHMLKINHHVEHLSLHGDFRNWGFGDRRTVEASFKPFFVLGDILRLCPELKALSLCDNYLAPLTNYFDSIFKLNSLTHLDLSQSTIYSGEILDLAMAPFKLKSFICRGGIELGDCEGHAISTFLRAHPGLRTFEVTLHPDMTSLSFKEKIPEILMPFANTEHHCIETLKVYFDQSFRFDEHFNLKMYPKIREYVIAPIDEHLGLPTTSSFASKARD